MTSGPPVWLLDVDGVINACSSKPDRSVWPADAWISTRVDGMPILAARPVLDFITAVHEAGRAEIRWHTTWRHGAQHLAEVLGLPTLAVQDSDWPAEPGGVWWKIPPAERVLRDEQRPLVWTDDDITWSLGRRGQDEMRGLGPVLFVSPQETLGLTPKHLRWIGDFLDLHPAESAAVSLQPQESETAA